MKKQNGFIYPFTIMITLFVFLTVSSYISLYVRELEFYNEKEELLKLENVLHLAINDVRFDLETNKSLTFNQNHLLLYPHGSAQYKYQKLSETKTRVDLRSITSNERKMTIRFEYDHMLKEVTKWVELN